MYYELNREVLGDAMRQRLDKQKPYPAHKKDQISLSDGKVVYGTGSGHHARRWAKSHDRMGWFYFVPGFGAGAGLWELLDHVNPMATVVVAERNMKLLRTALEYRDWRQHINSRRLLLIDDDDRITVHQRMQLAGDNPNRKTVVCSPLNNYDEQWWASILDLVLDYADAQRTGIMTQFCNSGITAENLLRNIHDFCSMPGIEELHDLHKDIPALLIAAGPSIQKQLPMLRMVRGAVIISVITMLKPLMNYEIVPHYVTALDYHQISARFLEDAKTANSILVGESKLNPAVFLSWKKLGGAARILGNTWMSRITNRWLPQLDSGGTVAHLNFALSEWMGCNPIIMVGQDLAFTDGKYYPQCVYDAHPWKLESQKALDEGTRPVRIARSMSGKPIATDEQMQCYAEQFYDYWANSKAEVIDCTAAGLERKGVMRGTLSKVIRQYKLNKKVNPEKIKASETLEGYERYIVNSQETHEQLKRVSDWCGLLHNALICIRDNWDNDRIRHTYQPLVTQYLGAIKDYPTIVYLIETHSGIAGVIKHWENTRIEAEKLDGQAKCLAQLERDITYVGVMVDSAESLERKLSRALSSLSESANQDYPNMNIYPLLSSPSSPLSSLKACPHHIIDVSSQSASPSCAAFS
jgi:hypothetical protein